VIRDVCGHLFRLNCNILNGESNLRCENFVLTLVCSAPPEVSLASMETALGELPDDLYWTVWQIDDPLELSSPSHSLVVYGRDQPGIIYRVAGVLDEKGVTICEMAFGPSLFPTPVPESIFSLVIEVPANLAIGQVEAALRAELLPIGLDCRLSRSA
jgi:predicted amino acid-binding ACT domain protein